MRNGKLALRRSRDSVQKPNVSGPRRYSSICGAVATVAELMSAPSISAVDSTASGTLHTIDGAAKEPSTGCCWSKSFCFDCRNVPESTRGGWDFVAGRHAGKLTMASRTSYHYLPTYPRTQIWM
eukprot:907596-Prymnesium_polylepis.1